MTDTIEYRTVDKAGWGAGPWLAEPDKRQWQDEATGLPCLIVRGPSGALCGYVGVQKGHAAHGADYDAVEVDVHGGLTYAGVCQHGDDPARGVCHIPGAGEPDDVWWFGFDCAHAFDLSPAYAHYERPPSPWSKPDEYRDVDYVTEQVTQLAAQLAGQP